MLVRVGGCHGKVRTCSGKGILGGGMCGPLAVLGSGRQTFRLPVSPQAGAVQLDQEAAWPTEGSCRFGGRNGEARWVSLLVVAAECCLFT